MGVGSGDRIDSRTGERIVYEFPRRARGPAVVDWSSDWWRAMGPINPFWALGPGAPVRGCLVGALLALALATIAG